MLYNLVYTIKIKLTSWPKQPIDHQNYVSGRLSVRSTGPSRAVLVMDGPLGFYFCNFWISVDVTRKEFKKQKSSTWKVLWLLLHLNYTCTWILHVRLVTYILMLIFRPAATLWFSCHVSCSFSVTSLYNILNSCYVVAIT